MANHIVGSFTIKIIKQQQQYQIQALDHNNDIIVESHPFIWDPNAELKKILNLFQDPIKVQRVSLSQFTSLGQAIYHAVFTPSIANALGRIQASLKEPNGIRIKLLVDPPELANLPWEIMHDNHDFIGLNSDYPLVRGFKDTSTIPEVPVRGKLKILYAWANPEDQLDLELQESAEKIKTLLSKNKKIHFEILGHATRDKLQSKLLDEDYHIFCFAGHAGHGDNKGIFLENDNKASDKVSSLTLARILQGKHVRLVFLAACDTAKTESSEDASFAESLIRDGNNAKAKLSSVVAMQYIAGDDPSNPTTEPLTAHFFEALASFRPVDIALSEARKSILDEHRQNVGVTRDVFAPVLYLQSESSNLFRRARNWSAIILGIALVIVAILGSIALYRSQLFSEEASLQSELRVAAELDRDVKERETISFDLAKQSIDALQENNIQDALGYAIQAAETTYKVDQTYTGAAEAALYQALLGGNSPVLASSNDPVSEVNDRSVSPAIPISVNSISPVFQISSETGSYRVYDAKFSPDGNYILTAKGPDVGLWDTQGNLKVTLDGIHGTDLLSMSFANDGSFFVTRELLDDVLRVWNTDGQLQVEFCTEITTDCDSNAHEDDIEGFSISPDNKYIVTIHNGLPIDGTESIAGGKVQEGSARLWTTTGQFIAEMKGHSDTVLDAQFFPNSLEILTSSRDGTAQIWDLDGDLLRMLDHGEPINMSIISPDGTHIVTAGDEGTVNIWDKDGNLYQTLRHDHPVAKIDFSSNNFHVLTLTKSRMFNDDTPVRLWDINGNLLNSYAFSNHISNAVFTPGGANILVLSNEPQLWNLEGQLIANFKENEGEYHDNVDFSSDDHHFLTIGSKAVWVWKVDQFQQSNTQSVDTTPNSSELSQNPDPTANEENNAPLEEVINTPIATLNGHTAYISKIIYNSTQKQFMTLPSQFNEDDGNILLWDENGSLITMFQGRPKSVISAEFNADGTRILTANDGKIRLWQNDGSLIAVLGQTEHFSTYGAISAFFNETGDYILTNISGMGNLWDSKGNLITPLNQTTNNKMGLVSHQVFSPDGSLAIATSCDEYGETNCISSAVRLWNMDGTIKATLTGHENFIYSAIVSPDGQLILTNADEGELWLWDIDGNLIAKLDGHQKSISDWAFSPTGQIFATGDSEGNAFIWNYEGEKLGTIESGDYQFNLEGTRLLSTERDKAQVWDTNGQLLNTYQELSWWKSLFEPSTNRFLAVIEDSNQISLWDTDGNLIKDIVVQSDDIRFTHFSPDGTKFITSDGYRVHVLDSGGELLTSIDVATNYAEFSKDSSQILLTTEHDVQLWATEGNILNTFVPTNNETILSQATFNPTESRILARTENNMVEMWKIERYTPSKPVNSAQESFQDIFISMATLSPSGQLIFTASNAWNSNDFKAYLWDNNGNKQTSFESHYQSIEALAISPDETLFVTADRDGIARLWKRDGTLLALLEGHTTNIFDVLFNADGTRILTVSDDATARLWDSQGNLISVMDGYVKAGWPTLQAGFSPNGEFIVTAGCIKSDAMQSSNCLNGSAHLWHSDNGSQITALADFDEINSNDDNIRISHLSFAPDDTRFSIYAEGWHVWDYSGDLVSTLDSGPIWVETATYSSDGEYFVAAGLYWNSGANIGTAAIWNREGDVVTTIDLKSDNTDIVSTHFNSTSDHIITSHVDGKSRIWSLDGTLIATLEGGLDAVFSPSDNRIASISEDGIVRLWGKEGDLLFAFQGHQGALSSAAFSSDETRLLTVGDETTMLWEIYPNIEEMLTDAKNRLSTFIPNYSDCFTDDTIERMPECFQTEYDACLTYLDEEQCGDKPEP